MAEAKNQVQQSPNQRKIDQDDSEKPSLLQLRSTEEGEVDAPNGYKFVKTIGDGSFGKVKLGVHVLTEENVAIKILCKDRIRERTDIERISRQIKIMKQVRHPFIVQMYQIIESPKHLFLVMEYIEGGDLFDAISNCTKLTEEISRNYFSQIILGLQYLHNLGITHRDMKPENILIADNGKIKIADFGLGNFFTEGQKLKTACGSPCYAPPQMLNQEQYDPRKVDIWSSGVILYAMIHGYLPFQDDVTTLLYQKIKTKNVRVASWVGIPCRNLLRGLLTKDKSQRLNTDAIKKHEFLIDEIEKQQQYLQRQIGEINIQQFKQNCEQLGIVQEDRLLNNLKKNKHNNLTTMYYLGKKKILRQAGNIEINASLQKQDKQSVIQLSEICDQPRKIYSFIDKEETEYAMAQVNQQINEQILENLQDSQINLLGQNCSQQIIEHQQVLNAPTPITNIQQKLLQQKQANEQPKNQSQTKYINQSIKDTFKESNKAQQIKVNTSANQEIKKPIKPIPSPQNKKSINISHQNIKKPEKQQKKEEKFPVKQHKALKKYEKTTFYHPKQDASKYDQEQIKLYERSHSKDRPIILKNNLKGQKGSTKQIVDNTITVLCKAIHIEPHLIDTQRIALCSNDKLCQFLSKKGLMGRIQYYSYSKQCIFISKAQLKQKKSNKIANFNQLEKIINQINAS